MSYYKSKCTKFDFCWSSARGVLERSLEITELLRGGGRRWWRPEAGLHIFWKKVRENLSLIHVAPAINALVSVCPLWIRV